jgi:hypothetical protein
VKKLKNKLSNGGDWKLLLPRLPVVQSGAIGRDLMIDQDPMTERREMTEQEEMMRVLCVQMKNDHSAIPGKKTDVQGWMIVQSLNPNQILNRRFHSSHRNGKQANQCRIREDSHRRLWPKKLMSQK